MNSTFHNVFAIFIANDEIRSSVTITVTLIVNNNAAPFKRFFFDNFNKKTKVNFAMDVRFEF